MRRVAMPLNPSKPPAMAFVPRKSYSNHPSRSASRNKRCSCGNVSGVSIVLWQEDAVRCEVHYRAEVFVSAGASLRAAAIHSQGMLLVSLIPIGVLVLGVTRAVDDDLAIWTALLVDTVLLGLLGWVAMSRWTPRFWPRLWGALITAGFGVVIIVLKVFVHH